MTLVLLRISVLFQLFKKPIKTVAVWHATRNKYLHNGQDKVTAQNGDCMKKVIFAVSVIAALVVAASYNVRIEVRANTAQACATSNC